MIEDRTGSRAVPVCLPIGAESELEGQIDLITMKEWLWKGEDLGASWEQVEIRDELKELADEWRGKMVEAAVEQDDDAMEAYLEGEEPDVAKPCAQADPQGHAGAGVRPRARVVPRSRTRVCSRC